MNPDEALEADRAIARTLPRSWPAFFQRFGRLTPVQREAIPPILDGRSTLVCAPTAAGKTEAACAPLVERFSALVGDQWTILYVSPTRALVNDLYERLWRPFEDLGLRLERRTGEHHARLDPTPHLLITTPESFDSMLCRAGRGEAHALIHVGAVVLDEIHLLNGTARGEQVRWLLQRLKRLRRQAHERGWTQRESLQITALSATVPDERGVLERYLPGGIIVHAAGNREIETVAVDAQRPTVEASLPLYLAQLQSPEKVLVFSNARRRVDSLATELRAPLEQLGYSIDAHHGSLSQRQRESAESRMKSERAIVLFATSTLEIGVDIGDVDLVVLDGPAPNVSALLQRVGRGNRRTGRTRLMACSGSFAEAIVQSAMIERARERDLGPIESGPHYAVARQQLASYIFQGPSRTRKRATLEDFLSNCLPREHGTAQVLDHLLSLGELQEDASGVRLGPDWLERSARGEIHSNIEEAPGSAVVDQTTGEHIASGVNFAGGSGLKIAGQLLQARRWSERTLEVRRVADARLAEGQWSYVSRAWTMGAGQPYAVRQYLGLAEEEWPLIVIPPHALVFHFGGARRKTTLELIAARRGGRGSPRVNPWFLELPDELTEKPPWLEEPTPGLLEMSIIDRLDGLERSLGRPAANRQLPQDLRINEVREWLCLEKETELIARSRWVRASGELSQVLTSLAKSIRSKRGARKSRPGASDHGSHVGGSQTGES